MTSPEPISTVDLIVLGGGCAGLSLASRLAERANSLRTLGIEARSSYYEDRTWCGWRTEPHFFSDCVKVEWNQWQVVTDGGTFRQFSAQYPYELIPADRFYNKACNLISASNSVNLILGADVEGVSDSLAGASVTLKDQRTFHAPWVIDTRPQQRTVESPWLWQNFVGYVVSFREGCDPFAGRIPTLMDFQPPDGSVAQFVYFLPICSDSYLVEWTRFASISGQLPFIEAQLIEWLNQRAGDSWKMERRESGSLPMALPAPENRKRVLSAGTRGGSMRASTGYAFHSIQRWADTCASSLLATGRPLAPQRNRLLEALDASFLTVLQRKSTSASKIFGDLFAHCEPDSLVRFLAGVPRAGDFWPVIHSLPWGPFLPTVPDLVYSCCKV
jgi:lycopene beta-cyclase